MGHKDLTGGKARLVSRWGSLALVLTLILGFVGQAARVEAIPADPTSSDAVDGPPPVGRHARGDL